MKQTALALLLGVLAAVAASQALAGSRIPGQHVLVTLNADGSGTASGQLGAIYNGSGTQEYIGCQVSVGGGLYCVARSESGTWAACGGSAYLAKTVNTMSHDAMVTFSWTSRGQCTLIKVLHSSEFEPKL